MGKKRKLHNECKTFVQVLLKLGERLPTNKMLVRNASSINPVNMAESPQLASKSFIKLADSLYSSSAADNAKFHFYQMLRKEVVNSKEKFLEFNFRKKRVDVFFRSHIGTNTQYKDLWKVSKLIFILSHGQSFMERGFSINKCDTDVNMQEESLVAQRFVYVFLDKSGKEIWDFPITKDIRKSCNLAYQKAKVAGK